MAIPKRCLPAALAAEFWEDGTRRSPDNAFNWNTGEPSVFNTDRSRANERYHITRNANEAGTAKQYKFKRGESPGYN